ncbi:hypothetical protein BGW38_000528 [Lunasporangiospora selenospora]|uniref:Uncharacterized protein n=1 Tax=Lunasporangiospora selenospora TaxID=979761 RepID=A0A9P6KEX6_9FUNG|nr:hypothetical protein BGW38_000528 [Lunasporangiospora selenospora]
MVDTELLTPNLPQEPRFVLAQDENPPHEHQATISLYHNHTHPHLPAPAQVHDEKHLPYQQQQQQHQDHPHHPHQPQHSQQPQPQQPPHPRPQLSSPQQKFTHDQPIVPTFQPHGPLPPFDHIAQDFLIQDLDRDPTPVDQAQHLLLHHAHVPATTAEAEDEIDIYDYIHAKQEDDDEADHDHDLSFVPSVSPDLGNDQDSAASVAAAIAAAAAAAAAVAPGFPISSSSTGSSSPSAQDTPAYSHDSSSASFAASDSISLHRLSPPADLLIKQESDDSRLVGLVHLPVSAQDSQSPDNGPDCNMAHFVDTDPSAVSSSGSSFADGPMDPALGLYGAASASLLSHSQPGMAAGNAPAQDLFPTTGSGTGMDSVEFMFNQGHQQQQQQQQSQQSQQQSQQPSKRPSFMKEDAMTDPETGLELSEAMDLTIDNVCDGFIANVSTVVRDSPEMQESTLEAMEDVMMEVAEPLGDLPSSPSYSSCTSGAVTPELVSPILHPSLVLSRSPPSTDVVKAAFAKAASQDSKKQKPTSPKAVNRSRRRSNNRSEQQSAKKGASESTDKDSSYPSTTMARPTSTRKRKLGGEREQSPERDSADELGNLPSPPSSVRASPPVMPMSVELPTKVERLELPPASLEKSMSSRNGAGMQTQPTTPTSPQASESFAERRLLEQPTTIKIEESEMALSKTLAQRPLSTTTESEERKTPPLNMAIKRPWTAEEEKLLLELVASNRPIKEIAETLDRSVHSVRSRRQVLTDPGFVKGNGHAQPRRSKPDPSSKLPTYSQMAFLSLARLPDLQGTLNDVASMVEKLFSRYLNRIPRTGHKNLQIWRAQISDALAHEKGHPRPRFESFGVKRGRQWVYRLTDFGRGVMEAMGGVDRICEDLLKNNAAAEGTCGPDGEMIQNPGGAGAGLGQGSGYGYSYSPKAAMAAVISDGAKSGAGSSSDKGGSSKAKGGANSSEGSSTSEGGDGSSPESSAAATAIANAMAAMAAGLAAMMAAEDEKAAAAAAATAASTNVTTTATATATNVSSASVGMTVKMEATLEAENTIAVGGRQKRIRLETTAGTAITTTTTTTTTTTATTMATTAASTSHGRSGRRTRT